MVPWTFVERTGWARWAYRREWPASCVFVCIQPAVEIAFFLIFLSVHHVASLIVHDRPSSPVVMRLFICLVLVQFACAVPWMHHVVLDADNNYHVQWSFNASQQRIQFNVCVRTKGWISFGISPNGGMTGSDLIVAWVDDQGKAHLQVWWQPKRLTVCNRFVLAGSLRQSRRDAFNWRKSGLASPFRNRKWYSHLCPLWTTISDLWCA